MAYDAPLPRLGAFNGGTIAAVGRLAAPRVRMQRRAWREFDRRDRIAAWDALAEWASEPNPFYESWYLLPSLRALDKAGNVTILTFETDGQLAGLMPVIQSGNYYGHPIPHLANWVHPNVFLGQPLVAQGFEHEFWRALLAWCDRHTRLSLFLHLAHVPTRGRLHDALAAVLREDARPAATVFEEERAMLRSAQASESYFEAALSAKKRKELRRQQRRLCEEGEVTFERLTDYSQIAEWTAEFLDLEARGWKGESGSAMRSHAATRELFRFAIAGSAARGRLERLALRLDGKPIAMLANFLTAPGAYSFKTAFDEDYARFSPGVLLQQQNLALLDREDIDWADSCAAQDHPMIDHLWRERRAIQRRSIGIGGGLRRAAFRTLIRLETGRGARGLQ
ncbi:GNAT family N-acetyltransferase [Erythrobacter westpacificensis]|uniref:GNAT family N-acetyltransferase n=1 Tax=Erythrobacter westpacificensis TaxID=1055231 RepID=A0ABP9KNG0_9SPHN